MNRSPRKGRDDKKGAPAWMVTYSDLMTLILVFFVLLFSMSQIDVEKFKALAESFNDRAIFNFSSSIVPSDPSSSQSSSPNTIKGSVGEKAKQDDSKEVDKLSQAVQEIQAFLEKNGLTDVISAERNERGVVLVLQEKVLFDSGQATILPEAKPFLDKVGELLSGLSNPVKIEGHTDNRPISTYRYPSNWELSGARASSVVRYFIERHQLEPRRFTSVGYGETRPIVPNTNEQNWQKNRRVEIVIADPTYSEKVE